MSHRRRFVINLIALGVVGIITGLFLGGKLLPSQVAGLQQYAKTTATNKTVITASDDKGNYTKTVVVRVTETTPHGDFYDFPPVMVSGVPLTSPDNGTVPPAISVTPVVNTGKPAATIPSQRSTEVWIMGRQMIPANITVAVGTEITWINRDVDIHTVTSDSPLFDKELSPQEIFKFTFTEKGTFDYHCEPHPEIIGTIVVE